MSTSVLSELKKEVDLDKRLNTLENNFYGILLNERFEKIEKRLNKQEKELINKSTKKQVDIYIWFLTN